MPTSRKTTKAAMAAAAAMPAIPKELIDPFVTGPMGAQAANAAAMAFKKTLIERALAAELSRHLGYRRGATKPEDAANHRNGASRKTVPTEDGPLRQINALGTLPLPRMDSRPHSRHRSS